ncbi:hypothetical protein AG1IA_06775 [Rhizoctonia solani AG-1 IA]|uniref:Uncharacterized protein n=1 Tax=Thanatephorus cucumeris (strain AG1-IA) TaxID=983506 RepID=L8WML4_THACA|nr:hypothetical protein AG1IA_06775 [Rhizoctonia solani AG-1 IA]
MPACCSTRSLIFTLRAKEFSGFRGQPILVQIILGHSARFCEALHECTGCIEPDLRSARYLPRVYERSGGFRTRRITRV